MFLVSVPLFPDHERWQNQKESADSKGTTVVQSRKENIGIRDRKSERGKKDQAKQGSLPLFVSGTLRGQTKDIRPTIQKTIGENDEPTTVEAAIFQSMTTLSSSFVLNDDGSSYIECNSADCVASDNPLLVVEDDTKSNSKIIAHQLKGHPQNSPMTPRQLLHLGCVWYLSAENFRKNEELKLQTEMSQDAEKFLFLTKNMTRTNSDNPQKRQNSKKNGMDKMVKPTRLTLEDSSMDLCEGDYLRIHHTPRRFRQIYSVDWTLPDSNDNQVDSSHESSTANHIDGLPFVVQQQGPGYCVINKPPIIPVHATVDNAVENVAHQLYLSLEEQKQQQNTTLIHQNEIGDSNNTTIVHKPDEPPYLAAVQRLDVNTSGLMVVATSPEFAAYFSQLLRYKTATILDHHSGNNTDNNATNPSIEKGYKCLVCIQPDESSGESVIEAWKRLSSLQRPKSTDTNINSNRTNIIRHFLQASDRAPKLFVDSIPEVDDDSKWYECLMEITEVGDPIPLFASSSEDDESSLNLANSLWPKDSPNGNSRIPLSAKAVVEVQVSLITGRTHQIRGQLSKLGFPIVGDEQYGGASPLPMSSEDETEYHDPEDPQLLALQCCHLGFRDAEYESVWHKKKRRDIIRGRPSRSGKWVRATLQNAWWTPFLEAQAGENGNAFSDIDFQDEIPENSDTAPIDIDAIPPLEMEIRSDMLPPTVQLSPGRNKYVLAKLTDPGTNQVRWFVQSAPLPYHAEVAFDLLEWIAAVPGYQQTRVEVTGGGRIDYNPSTSTVSVYGFSYRYGKGDHQKAADLIENSEIGANLKVSFDLSDNLY